jgi:hypothetical protein
MHGVPVRGDRKWDWNGSADAPTLTPSVLIYGHDSTPPFKPQPRCHSFVREGRMEYCADSEHALAGQNVDIPNWEEATK